MKKFKGINGSTLKILAITTMLIDHIGAAVLEYWLKFATWSPQDEALYERIYQVNHILRSIGRLALPIFCFLLVEGYIHTKNHVKYAQRLLLFALISEIPFDLAFFNSIFAATSQNIYFTLFIGFLVMFGIEYFDKKVIPQTLVCAAGLCTAQLLSTDYGFKGIFLIIVLYYLRNYRTEQALCGAVAISWQRIAGFAFLPIYVYNGKRGLSLKYLFYWFYPVHLLILTGIARLLMP